MKIKNILLTLGLILGATSVAFAQTDTFTVSLQVAAGTSSLTINETAVDFNGPHSPVQNSSRFESDNVTGSYFVANGGAGGWKITVSTQNSGNVTGLVDSSGNNIALFKVDQGADGDVTNAIDWADENNAQFSFVLDDGADVDDAASVASSANQDPASNNNLLFNFGVDIAGAAVGTYGTTIIVELALLP